MALKTLMRHRNLGRLWLDQTTSRLGNAVLPVALALTTLRVTHSATDLGIVLVAQSVPVIAFVLVGGVLADRWPRRQIMVAADILRALAQGGLAILVAVNHATFVDLITAAAITGLGSAFFNPAFNRLIPILMRDGRLQQVNALLDVTANFVSIVGPALSGALIVFGGDALPFIVNAVTFAVSVVLVLTLNVPDDVARSADERLIAALRTGWQEVTRRVWLKLGFAWYSTFFLVVIAPIDVLGPVIAVQYLGGAYAWSAIATALTVGGFFGGLVVMVWRPEFRLRVPASSMQERGARPWR